MRLARGIAVITGYGASCLMLVSVPAAAQTPVPGCRVQGSHQWLATRPSPLDSTTLMIGNTIAKICYSRPSLRGRTIESLLPLRVAWRTGANEPATITLTSRLSVGGAALAPGRYVILTVPQAEQWILVFNTTPDTEPGKMFKSLKEVGLGTGRVEHVSDPIEQFTIRAVMDSIESSFILEWGERRVRIPVRTVPE
jgi:hypothetical protein